MVELVLSALKLFLIVLGSVGIVFHLLVLKSPETASKVEQKLGTELGIKKKFVPWLEKNRMGLAERLMRNKAYNIIAIIFLLLVLTLLFQIQT